MAVKSADKGRLLWGAALALAAILAVEIFFILKLRAAPRPLVGRTPPAAKPSPPPPPVEDQKQPRSFVIVIDPGHTPEEFGALSARGAEERSFNQRLAALIIAALHARGVSTVLTNGPGESVSLHERSALANRKGASLFLSVHHDSSEEAAKKPWTFQGRKLLYCDKYGGFSLFVSEKPETFAASHRFAGLLGRAFVARGFKPCLHHADKIKGEGRKLLDPALGVYAFPELAVLRETAMPAVLAEYGFIINRKEEERLSDPKVQARLAEATVEAVLAFKAEWEKGGP